MSGGHVVKLGKGASVKGGKVKVLPIYRDASAAIRAKNSTEVTVKRKTP